MNTKLDKKAKKRDNSESTGDANKETKEPKPNKSKAPKIKNALNGANAKKRKLSDSKPETNGTDNTEMPKGEPTPEPKSLLSNINKSVFAIFKKLQSHKLNQKHFEELIALLKNETDVSKRTATCVYALKRLVRCTGADDKEAVALNASYINGILRTVPDIDLMELLENMKRDLPVGNQLKGKEENLAAVGQITTAFSIMQTEHFQNAKPALIESIYQILTAQLKGREYLIGMCAQLIADSFKQLSQRNFKAYVWPLLQPLLAKPCSSQKLHNCDLLLAVHLSYPQILSSEQLVNYLWQKQPQYEQLFNIYLSSLPSNCDGPYERLGKYLSQNIELLQNWTKYIDATPLKQNAAKSCTIKVLNYILLNYKHEEQQPIIELFSSPLISMLTTELAAAKQKRHQSKPSQLQLRANCRAFEVSLLLSFEHVLKTDECKLSILRCLLQAYIKLDNITQTPRFTQQLINHLSASGLKQIYEFYHDLLISADEQTTKSTREHCLNQMQHILQHAKLEEDSKWRKKQLKFLMLAGLFHLDASQSPCLADAAATYSQQTAARCEEIFFSGILNKCSDLVALCKVLRHYAKLLAKQLDVANADQMLRVPRDAEAQKSWAHVKHVLETPSEEKVVMALAFDALILFLGFVLCTRSSVPVNVINDLIICKKRALDQQAGKPNDSADELFWQDVLTDALLELLLPNGHFWRQFVNAVAAVLMPQLQKDNLEQMLMTLDMTKNPLSEGNEQDENMDSEEEAESEEETSDSDNESEKNDDEENDEEEENEVEDDDESRLTQIRESVRLALSKEADVDDGSSSVDWNDVDEEEGERLNAALERAFQAFKPNKTRKSQKPHQTKSERISSTTLLHFRIRVLDLVELFIKKQPHMDAMLDALCSVYQVYKVSSSDEKLKSLKEASKKLLHKLLTQKIENKSKETQAILDCIEQFMAPSDEQQSNNKTNTMPTKPSADLLEWRDKCVGYLVAQFGAEDASTICPLIEGYVRDWVTKRNSSHRVDTFEALFQTDWDGRAQLAVSFASYLQLEKTRSFRRIQILGLLVKQHRQLKAAFNGQKKAAKQFDKSIEAFVEQLMAAEKSQVTGKEIKILLKLLRQGDAKWTKLLARFQDFAKLQNGKTD